MNQTNKERVVSFPETPTCHGAGRAWRPPTAADRPFRSCDYCGSVHPEDLLKLFEGGARLQGTDWKYGWPHKFYVVNSADSSFFGKFYSEHILGEGFSPEARDALIHAVWRHSAILFVVTDDGRLKFSSPRYNFQG